MNNAQDRYLEHGGRITLTTHLFCCSLDIRLIDFLEKIKSYKALIFNNEVIMKDDRLILK